MKNAKHSVFSDIPAFVVVARRFVQAPKNSGWSNLAIEVCDDENEAKALAIELSGTDGAEEVVISREAFGTPFGGVPEYWRRIELSDEVSVNKNTAIINAIRTRPELLSNAACRAHLRAVLLCTVTPSEVLVLAAGTLLDVATEADALPLRSAMITLKSRHSLWTTPGVLAVTGSLARAEGREESNVWSEFGLHEDAFKNVTGGWPR